MQAVVSHGPAGTALLKGHGHGHGAFMYVCFWMRQETLWDGALCFKV
jgi:hypothetical protein